MLRNAGALILSVQAILGHQRVDTTLNYAILCNGTVAADYDKAMAQVESRLSREEPESGRMPDLRGEVLALLEAMEKDTLTDHQTNILSHRKGNRMALDIRNVSPSVLISAPDKPFYTKALSRTVAFQRIIINEIN